MNAFRFDESFVGLSLILMSFVKNKVSLESHSVKSTPRTIHWFNDLDELIGFRLHENPDYERVYNISYIILLSHQPIK